MKPHRIKLLVSSSALVLFGCRSDPTVIDAPRSHLDEVTKTPRPGADDSSYDAWLPRRASGFLPPELLSGPHHSIRESVRHRGPSDVFDVESEFGEFEVQGQAMLRRLVRELDAIAALREISESESFRKGVGDAMVRPLEFVKNLALNPIDTVTGIPKGLYTFVVDSISETVAERTDYEDSYLASLATVSKYKRKYADQFGIDVYTTNTVLQEDLNRICWPAGIGNWTPSIVTKPATATVVAVAKAGSFSQSLNDLLLEEPPASLWARNDRELERMGVALDLRRRFLNQMVYSPRHATVIVSSLASMDRSKHRERVLEQSHSARTEQDAFAYQQLVEILGGYGREVSPVADILVYRGLPLAFAENGSLVLAFPVDYGRWTQFSENLFVGFARLASTRTEVKKAELWITGTLSPLARRKIEMLGIAVTERAEKKIGMMD